MRSIDHSFKKREHVLAYFILKRGIVPLEIHPVHIPGKAEFKRKGPCPADQPDDLTADVGIRSEAFVRNVRKPGLKQDHPHQDGKIPLRSKSSVFSFKSSSIFDFPSILNWQDKSAPDNGSMRAFAGFWPATPGIGYH